jgi:GGDEF domain-containing protein
MLPSNWRSFAAPTIPRSIFTCTTARPSNPLQDGAAVAADRLRELVAGCLLAEQSVPVTISVGVSGCEGGPRTLDELIKQADIALYQAKRSVGNCVRRFEGTVPAEAAPANS